MTAAVYGGCSSKSRYNRPDALGAGGTAGAVGTTSEAGATGEAGAAGDSAMACSAGEVDCEGLVPQQCSEEGEWVPTRAGCAVACLDGECVDCVEGARECKDGAVQECVGGSLTTLEVCENTCEGESCVDECTQDRYQCNGDNSLQRCVNGEFVDDTECDYLCDAGECTGECVPDTLRCNPDADNESQSCNGLGIWDESEPCDGGTFCVDGDCRPCSPGSQRCAQAGPQLCSDAGEWVNQGACDSDAPACLDGECVLCDPGDKRCSDNDVEECASDGGAWEVVETCSGSTPACLASSKTCGKCSDGETQCSNDRVETCDGEGAWQTTESCSGSTPRCFDSECTECNPDTSERRCSDTNTAQACDADGSWGATTDCTGDTPTCRTDLNFACGCDEGERRCRNNTVPELCNGGAWVAQSSCSGQLDYCLPATGRCVDCVPGTQECQSGVAYECTSQGAWQSLDSCAGTQINCGGCDLGEPCGDDGDCNSGFCVNDVCAVCEPGDRECVGVLPRLCSSQGTWVDQNNCSGNTPVCLPSTGMCVECNNGATQNCGNCNLGTQSCSSNQWGNCTGAPDLQTSNQHCGSCNNACGSRETCSSGNCVCSSGNHSCGTPTPCYADDDAAHCSTGSSCIDCTLFSGATSCSGGGCVCEDYTFGCSSPTQPACGNWDFEPPLGVAPWQVGNYYTTNSALVGNFFISDEQASSGTHSLAANVNAPGPQTYWVQFEVRLCPGGASAGLPSSVLLSYDIYPQSDPGFTWPGANLWVELTNYNASTGNLDCGNYISNGETWFNHSCVTGGPNVAYYNIIVVFNASWQGTLFIDDVSIGPP